MISWVMNLLYSVFSLFGIGQRVKGKKNLVIKRPADLRSVLNGRWRAIDSETDRYASSILELDFIGLVDFVDCLRFGEKEISGGEKLKRLKDCGRDRLDIGFFLALWQEDDHETLERLYRVRGIRYLDFFGTIISDGRDEGYVLALYRHPRLGWLHQFKSLYGPWTSLNGSAVIEPIVL